MAEKMGCFSEKRLEKSDGGVKNRGNFRKNGEKNTLFRKKQQFLNNNVKDLFLSLSPEAEASITGRADEDASRAVGPK